MIIYTDGACQGNGKVENTGGFGVIILNNDGSYKTSYQRLSKNTTNNREELKAILYSLIQYGTPFGETPIVYSDSNYCVQTFTNWMFSWARNGWKKGDKNPPENLDLILTYYDLLNKGYNINLQKIKGHSGIIWNEYADKLATGKITVEQLEMEVKNG